MAHPGGPGQKLYQQQPQQPFMSSMTPGPMGALPPPNGAIPVRNPSPNAATPANAPTPGGPGAGRGMTKPPTPANAQTPFACEYSTEESYFGLLTSRSSAANAPTPGARPGTASGQPNQAMYTPRMSTAEAMVGVSAGAQSSPRTMQRSASTNMGLQQGQPQQQQVQQGHSSQPGGPQTQPGGPGGSGGPMDHSAVYRTTPAQMEIQRRMQIYGPSQGQAPMDTGRYGMSAGPNSAQALSQQDQQRQRQVMNPPPQGMIVGPLQPQHTGGSMSSQTGPLQPQHTGGTRPLIPQHTGGSMQDLTMNGPGGAASVPGGRTSVPSTPQMANRQASMSMSGVPTGIMPAGSVPMPMGTMSGMPAMYGHPMGSGMVPLPRNESFRPHPQELGDVSATTMGHGGMIGTGSS
jgi:hypothetical protein